MSVIYSTEYNTRRYGITSENKGCIKVKKFEDIANHEYNIFCVKPLEKLLGKSEICDMTLMSGAFDKSVFDGNTILLKLCEENDRHKYVYIVGDMLFSFPTNDKIHKYISNM